MESSSKLLDIVMMSAPSLIACSIRSGVSFSASPVQPESVQFDLSPYRGIV
jgi:lipoprotein